MVQLNGERRQLVDHSETVPVKATYRDKVSIVSLVKSDIASITSSSPNRAHLSTICDAMSCISVNSQVLIIRVSKIDPISK